jgi:transcriptional regulator with XRE-family HTH domain
MADVKAIRKELGLSQEELGARLGVKQSTISRFETGVLVVDERTRLALDALQMLSERKAA